MDRPPLPQTPMASSWATSHLSLVHPDGYFADLRSENGAFLWDIPASDLTRASSGAGLCPGVRHSTPASAKSAPQQEPFLSLSLSSAPLPRRHVCNHKALQHALTLAHPDSRQNSRMLKSN